MAVRQEPQLADMEPGDPEWWTQFAWEVSALLVAVARRQAAKRDRHIETLHDAFHKLKRRKARPSKGPPQPTTWEYLRAYPYHCCACHDAGHEGPCVCVGDEQPFPHEHRLPYRSATNYRERGKVTV